MKSLILFNGEYATIFYCPFCWKITDNIESNDYVKANCLAWCDKCYEILLCLNPIDYDGGDCSEKITKIQAEQFLIKNGKSVEEMNKIIEESIDYDCNFRLASVIKITHLADYETFDGYNKGKLTKQEKHNILNENYQEVNICKFKDVPISVDTSHDGVFLYYKGSCTECNRHYESYIWGD